MGRTTFAAAFVLIVIQFTPYEAKPRIAERPVAIMPPECANKNFCIYHNVPADYPTDVIKDLLNKTVTGIIDYASDKLTPRVDDEVKDIACKSKSSMGLIYKIRDNAGNVLFVVQSEGKFMQRIKIVECENTGPLTSDNFVQTSDLNLTCKQCSLNYKFLVLSLDATKLESVDIKGGLPVCCKCFIE